MPTFLETMSGGVSISGTPFVTAVKKYFPTGLVITTGGSATAFIAWSKLFTFDIVTDVTSTISFSWNVGQQPLYFYRVVWCCKYTNPEGNSVANPPSSLNNELGGCSQTGISNPDPTCSNLPQKQFMLQNVLARDVPDLCKQLSIQNYNWQICQVQRWSRPVDTLVDDPNPDCNVLEDISLDGYTECILFNVQTNALIQTEIEVFLTSIFLNYTGDGIILTGGSADAGITAGGVTPTISLFSFASVGGNTHFGGSAIAASNWNNSLLTKIIAQTFMTLEEAFFGATEAPTLAAPVGTIFTNCSACTALPTNLFIHQNFNNPSVLQSFLKRNGFSFDSPLSFLYSKKLNSWLAHQHFTGLGEDNINNEYWRFAFEFSCVDEIAAEPTDSYVIKFAISITRKNLATQYDSDTKIIVVFPSYQLCGIIKNYRDDLMFSLNVLTGLVSVVPAITPQSVLFADGIGIFKSSYWLTNPNLKIRISTSDIIRSSNTQDLSYILPQPVTQFQEGGNFVPSSNNA